MKLHLPFSLRKAVLTCMAVSSSFTATLATGAMVGGAFVCTFALQAEAAEIECKSAADIPANSTRSDVVIFDFSSGELPSNVTRIQGKVKIKQAQFSGATAGTTLVFDRGISDHETGTGDFVFKGTDNVTFQFSGNGSDDGSGYTGDYLYDAAKYGTFWFKNGYKVVNGNIKAEHADSLVKLGALSIYSDSISTGKIEFVGNAKFINEGNEKITLKAISGITVNSGCEVSFDRDVILGHKINNNGTLVFNGNIELADSMGAENVPPTTNGYESCKYDIIANAGTITLSETSQILFNGKNLLTTDAIRNAFITTGSVDVAAGTVYCVVEAASAVDSTSDATKAATGYKITGAGSTLTVANDLSSLSDGILVNVGTGGAATIELSATGKLDASKISVDSGKLHMVLAENAALSLNKANAINGKITVGSGATLNLGGAEALKNAGTLTLNGGSAVLGQSVNLYQDVNFADGASVDGGSLQLANSAKQYYVSVSGEGNSMSAGLGGSGALVVEVDSGSALQLTGKVNHAAIGKEAFQKLGKGVLELAGTGGHVIAGQLAHWGGEIQLNANTALQGEALLASGATLSVNKGAQATINTLNLSGGAFAVDSTSSAILSTLTGQGTVTVANGGVLTLNSVNLSQALNIAGTVVAGTDFAKTGSGALTLDVLAINGAFTMNGHKGLNVGSFDVAAGSVLTYTTAEGLVNIGAINQSITLNVSDVVESLAGDGMCTGITYTSDADFDLLSATGIKDYSFYESDGLIYIKAELNSGTTWDKNWGLAGLANPPAEVTTQEAGTLNVVLGFAPTEITGGGSDTTVLIGGNRRNNNSTAVTLEDKDTWLNVTGGTFLAVVGGNVNVGDQDSDSDKGITPESADFIGDTHVQMSGGTAQYVIGGNRRDYGIAEFTGNTYVSVYEGATVTYSIIGGSTMYYGCSVVLDGNTNVFVYDVLQDGQVVEGALVRGFVLGGNYTEGFEGGTAPGTRLDLTGDTHVTVDLSGYKGTATEFIKHVVGGHYMKDGGNYTTSIGGTTHVNIVGKEGIHFTGDVVAGTWAESATRKNDLNNTSLTISGNSVFDGRVMGGAMHNTVAGSSEISGTVSVDISGGTFNNHVVGGSCLGFVAASQYGGSVIGKVEMDISGGTFNKTVAGGSLVVGNGDMGTVGNVVAGNITMNLGGTAKLSSVCGGHYIAKRDVSDNPVVVGDVTITLDGATVGTLYGGCYIDSNNGNPSAIQQGNITINLVSGTITNTLFAAGGTALAEKITTASATVNVGQGFTFKENAAIYGAYSREGKDMTFAKDGSGSTLKFAESGTYTNTAGLTACDFDTIEVASGTQVALSGVQNGSKSLTKSGAGTLTLSSALAADAVNLRGGLLNVASVNSQGMAVDAVAGASMHVQGGLTLSALTVDMAQFGANSPVLTLDGALSVKDNVLEVNLPNYSQLASGTYKLLSMSSVENLANIQLKYDPFTGAASNMEYKLVLSATGLEFRYTPISTWTWEDENDVWSDSTNEGWAEDNGTAQNQEVYFTGEGAQTNQDVNISGEVTPAGIEIQGGIYTFKTTDGTGSIVMEEGESLKINSSATLNMNMANEKMAGTVDLQGTLVLNNEDGLGEATLQFAGGSGTLVYGDGISTDLSEQVVADNGMKVQVSDSTAVTWGTNAATTTENSGVEAALSNGLEKSGKADFTLQLAHGNSLGEYAGALTVTEGALNIKSLEKGTAGVKLSGDVDIADGAKLHVDSNLKQSGTAVELAGKLSGKGSLSFGNSTTAEYKLSADNSGFAGNIDVAAGRKVNFAQGAAAGGANASLLLNGGVFSVGGGTVASQLELKQNTTYASAADAAFTGALTGTGALTLGVTGNHTTTFTGNVAGFAGTLDAGTGSTIKFAGTQGGEIQATLGGSGTFCVANDTSAKLTGKVTGSAGVQQSGKGLLILASAANDTTGALTVDSGSTVQLGDAASAAKWNGQGGLAGGGTFVLANGTLTGLTSVASGTKLEVRTQGANTVATYALRRTSTPATVTISGSDLSKISVIELVAGSTLKTDAQVKVGGTTALTLNLTSANFGAVQEGAAPQGLSAMINTQGHGMLIEGTDKVELNLDAMALTTALEERGPNGDVYLRLVDANLSFGNDVDINSLLPKLQQYGVKAVADANAAKAGYIIINGDLSGVYFTKNHDTNSTNLIKVDDARLATYSGVVVNAGDTLEIALNDSNGIDTAIINNLIGAADATLKVTKGAVELRNFYTQTGVSDPDYATMGADNTFGGSIVAGMDTQITVSGAAGAANQGSLTVVGNVQADAVELKSGALHLLGADNKMNSYTTAAGTTTTLAAGQSLQLKNASLSGCLEGDAGSTLRTTGTVQMVQASPSAALSGVALAIESGKVDMDGAICNLESLTAAKGATLSGIGATVTVGDYDLPAVDDDGSDPGIAPLRASVRAAGSSTFAGTLAGSVDDPNINYGNDLNIGSGHTFTFANATGSSRWNANVQGNLVVDATAGKAMELGQLSLKEGASLTLRFNSDLRAGNNLNVLDLRNLDLASPTVDGQTASSFSITLVSTGLAQLEAGRYILGELPGGISFDGIAYQATEVELSNLTLDLQGTAFSRMDLEQCKLIASEGNFVLNLVMSNANPLLVEGAEPNTNAGAALLWQAVTPEDGDLQAVYNSVNYMLADGNTKEASRALAAVAGASATTLGTAYSGDVERQLRAIRNRTTTMGVDQCVYHDEMPYLNAWINAEGNHAEMDADGMAAGYTLDNWGGTVGFDVDLTPRFTMGMALTAMYGDLTADGPENTAEGDLDTYYLSAFARYSTRAWTHTFVATFGRMDGTMERTLNHTYGSYTTKGETDGNAFGLMYEVGRTFALDDEGNSAMQLIGNVAYRHVTVGGYEEKNSDAALRFGDQTLDTLTLSAGARVQAVVGENLFERTTLFEARALAKFDVGDRASEADVALLHGKGRSTVESAELGAFGLELGAGLSIPVGNVNDGTIFFDVSAELRDGYTNVNGTAGYRINF